MRQAGNRTNSLWPDSDPHPLLTSGALHLSSYLLRLLDEHRPNDPLVFLQSVLRRGGGGMMLDPPILLELLRLATNVPSSTLLETLRFSLMNEVADPRDALWRQVTFESVKALTHIAKRRVAGGAAAAAAAAQTPSATTKRPIAASGTNADHRLGSSYAFSSIIRNDSALPSFDFLYKRGAPWQILFAHNVVTSRCLVASVTGSSTVPPGTDASFLLPPRKTNNNSSSSLKLHLAIEIDAEDPKSGALFLRRADDADGGELLNLIVEEIGLLSSTLPADVVCTLDFVLISSSDALRNLQSATHALFRQLRELVERYSQPHAANDDLADDSLTVPKPPCLRSIRVLLGDATRYSFAPLQALFDVPFAGAAAGSSIDVRSPDAYVFWLRNVKNHTELLLQLGHMLYPFALQQHLLATDGTGSNIEAPIFGLLDVDGCLVLDTTRGLTEVATKPKILGATVTRSYLSFVNRSPEETWASHLLRHVLRTSCGDIPGHARLLPPTSPCVLIRLGTQSAITVIPQLAHASRVDGSSDVFSALPERTGPASYLARLQAAATSIARRSGIAATNPATQRPCALFTAVGGGIMLRELPQRVSTDELIVALREAALIVEADSSVNCDVTLSMSTTMQATQAPPATASSPAAAPDASLVLSQTAIGYPPNASSSSWRDVLLRCSAAPFERMARRDPMSIALRRLDADRHNIESAMRQWMPRPGVVSRQVYIAVDDVDEESKEPVVRTNSFVQELSAQYVADFLDGAVKTPRTIAQAALQQQQAAEAAAAASAAASASANASGNGEKKRKAAASAN